MGINQFADRYDHEMPKSGISIDEEAMTFYDAKKLLKGSLKQAIA